MARAGALADPRPALRLQRPRQRPAGGRLRRLEPGLRLRQPALRRRTAGNHSNGLGRRLHRREDRARTSAHPRFRLPGERVARRCAPGALPRPRLHRPRLRQPGLRRFDRRQPGLRAALQRLARAPADRNRAGRRALRLSSRRRRGHRALGGLRRDRPERVPSRRDADDRAPGRCDCAAGRRAGHARGAGRTGGTSTGCAGRQHRAREGIRDVRPAGVALGHRLGPRRRLLLDRHAGRGEGSRGRARRASPARERWSAP